MQAHGNAVKEQLHALTHLAECKYLFTMFVGNFLSNISQVFQSSTTNVYRNFF